MIITIENNRKWTNVLRAKLAGEKLLSMKLMKERLTGFVGCSDYPGVLLIPELLELYPNAKVVLVTRDADRWWESYKAVCKPQAQRIRTLEEEIQLKSKNQVALWATSLLPRILVQIAPGMRWMNPYYASLGEIAFDMQEAYGYQRGFGPRK
jgi:hypothetical protein